jgi:hypothetical protein
MTADSASVLERKWLVTFCTAVNSEGEDLFPEHQDGELTSLTGQRLVERIAHLELQREEGELILYRYNGSFLDLELAYDQGHPVEVRVYHDRDFEIVKELDERASHRAADQ